jgi:hypothetical protein
MSWGVRVRFRGLRMEEVRCTGYGGCHRCEERLQSPTGLGFRCRLGLARVRVQTRVRIRVRVRTRDPRNSQKPPP